MDTARPPSESEGQDYDSDPEVQWRHYIQKHMRVPPLYDRGTNDDKQEIDFPGSEELSEERPRFQVKLPEFNLPSKDDFSAAVKSASSGITGAVGSVGQSVSKAATYLKNSYRNTDSNSDLRFYGNFLLHLSDVLGDLKILDGSKIIKYYNSKVLSNIIVILEVILNGFMVSETELQMKGGYSKYMLSMIYNNLNDLYEFFCDLYMFFYDLEKASGSETEGELAGKIDEMKIKVGDYHLKIYLCIDDIMDIFRFCIQNYTGLFGNINHYLYSGDYVSEGLSLDIPGVTEGWGDLKGQLIAMEKEKDRLWENLVTARQKKVDAWKQVVERARVAREGTNTSQWPDNVRDDWMRQRDSLNHNIVSAESAEREARASIDLLKEQINTKNRASMEALIKHYEDINFPGTGGAINENIH